jgi:hypothetical protein
MDGSRDHISWLSIISTCELSKHNNETTPIQLIRKTKKEPKLFFP